MTEEMSVEDALTLQLIEQTARADAGVRENTRLRQENAKYEAQQRERIAELTARLGGETARADEMGRMVTLTEKTLVTRSNRIAELERDCELYEEGATKLAKRIAALEAYIKAQGGNFTGPDAKGETE